VVDSGISRRESKSKTGVISDWVERRAGVEDCDGGGTVDNDSHDEEISGSPPAMNKAPTRASN
jgi:hypothetical protein